MSEHDLETDTTLRPLMASVGMGAGLSFWFLIEKLPDITENDRLVLALASLVFGFFAVLLAALGPLKLARASLAALSVALPTTGFLTLASLRFETVDGFAESGHSFAAYFLLGLVATPFMLAAFRPGQWWRDYSAVFTHSWEIVMRYGVGAAFTGIVWLVIHLSNDVLRIVQIDLINRFLNWDPASYMITGVALGLGMAVVWDLRQMISPDLVIRLFRLLLPVVLVVSLVFLAAVPLNGLSGLFGRFSAAATLLAMAAAGVTLITLTVDYSDARSAASPVLAWSARGMALATPLLAALAVWAITARVVQYGWTPARLAAATASAIAMAYGLAYALSVLRGTGWRAHIRRSNVGLALALAFLAALWLSPILNAERISVNSQIARFEAGKTEADALDLWAIGKEWGRVGEAALVKLLADDAPKHEALASNITRFEDAENRYQYERHLNNAQHTEELLAKLREVLPIRPEGARLPDGLWANADEIDYSDLYFIERLVTDCERETPARGPACVAVVGDFLPETEGEEVLFVYQRDYGVDARAVVLPSTGETNTSVSSGFTRQMPGFLPPSSMPADLIDEILAGNFSIGPAPINALYTRDRVFGVSP